VRLSLHYSSYSNVVHINFIFLIIPLDFLSFFSTINSH
jgi:hypothetical protein